jgi:GcrA cell cycle regulator
MGAASGDEKDEKEGRDRMMEPTNWTPAHLDALREFLTRGMSYSEITKAINTRFHTNHSRNAVLGRGRRMRFVRSGKPEAETPPSAPPTLGRLGEHFTVEPRVYQLQWRPPVFKPAKRVKLRCVDVEPRHLSLIDLERGDCRYPYGGDEEGEAITFCGHPKRRGSSYCTPHFHLSRNPVVCQEQAVGTASLRVVAPA